MLINTSRFGEIDIPDEKFIEFAAGLPGFEQCKRFALISTEETAPFHWLQSVEIPDIALAVIDPFKIFPDYAPRVSETMLSDIGSPPDEDILLFTVAVIPGEVSNMTTNLVSPILINAKTNAARQVILEGSNYQIRHPIYELVCNLLNGGANNAGSDPQD